LAFGENREVCLVPRQKATVAATAFCLRQTKNASHFVLWLPERVALKENLTEGRTRIFFRRVLLPSHPIAPDSRASLGQAIMSEEGKMDDGLEFSRAQVEESRTARVIRKCGSLFNKFIV
ncbi:unnamed protein product, partial [Ixodes pacificus]